MSNIKSTLRLYLKKQLAKCIVAVVPDLFLGAVQAVKKVGTMWVQVYLLPYLGVQPVSAWVEENSQQVNEVKWRESSSAWPRWLQNKASSIAHLLHPVEVFLYLDEELGVGDKYQISFLVNLLGHARRATWGANIYIVVGKGDIQQELLRGQSIRDEWFETLLEENVTDIVEIKGEFLGQKLMDASALSRQRRKILRSLFSERGWQCYIFEPPLYRVGVHRRFLSSFATNDVAPKGYNCVLVLTTPLSLDHVRFIKETLKSYPRYKFLVSVIGENEDEGGDSLYSELQIACRNKCEIIICRGLFELHYLLQKLNATRVENLRLNWAEQFARTLDPEEDEKDKGPYLLITHAFVAGSDFEYCHAAAANVYKVIESHSLGDAKIVLYPAITTAALQDILKLLGTRRKLIWLHIGHGKVVNGVQESDSEIFKRPEDWLKCFATYGGHLVMVCFYVRGSERLASRFAQLPIGPAKIKPNASIGFSEDVSVWASQLLTEKLIPIAVQTNGDPQAIRLGFEQVRQLLVDEYEEKFPIYLHLKKL